MAKIFWFSCLLTSLQLYGQHQKTATSARSLNELPAYHSPFHSSHRDSSLRSGSSQNLIINSAPSIPDLKSSPVQPKPFSTTSENKDHSAVVKRKISD